MKYGMPYKGSKNKIAEWVISNLPPAKHFYDLFGGGGAISHCALLSGKYEIVHYNEINPVICKGFRMAVNGEFKGENRWISRDDFLRLKSSDPYVAMCFSFGNDCKYYAYSPKNEILKKALHYSICFNENKFLSKIVNIKDLKYTSNDLYEKRMFLRKYLKSHIEEIKKFFNTKSGNIRFDLQSLEITNLDYRDVKIEKDSVIYCDIPYIGTKEYV